MVDDELIIDVGMHTGQDTANYLAKGFRVVAVEADPALVEAANHRFAGEMADGRLRIVHGAVSEEVGTVALAVADGLTEWSSVSEDFIARQRTVGLVTREVEVPAVRFQDVLEVSGIPHYLKIDIEGADMLAVRALRDFEDRPHFVSIETVAHAGWTSKTGIFDELAELWTLGYRRFQYVPQGNHSRTSEPVPAREGGPSGLALEDTGSGLFGEELAGEWIDVDAALDRARRLRSGQKLINLGMRYAHTRPVRAFASLRRSVGRPVPWYDLHARLD